MRQTSFFKTNTLGVSRFLQNPCRIQHTLSMNTQAATRRSGVTALLCGGSLDSWTLAVSRDYSQSVVAEIFAHRLLLITSSVDRICGLGERISIGSQRKKSFLQAARKQLFCNSSSSSAHAPIYLAPRRSLQRVISGRGVRAELVDFFEQAGIELNCAEVAADS